MKILIVDDNATVRRLVRCAISELAKEILECSDGDEVNALYAQYHPDLVLMDIRMPRMDGLRAIRALRASFPDARVFIVTDLDDEEMRDAAFEAGACGFASKQNLTDLDMLILGANPPVTY